MERKIKEKIRHDICYLLSTYILLTCMTSSSRTQTPTVSYTSKSSISSSEPFANLGGEQDIYIGKQKDMYALREKNPDDIYIVDKRDAKDPDMAICDSYKITDPEIMEEILDVMEEYEKKYPSLWKRSVSSMKKEWIVHNIAYYLGYHTPHTEEVDLNNDAEEDFNNNRYIRQFHKHQEKMAEEQAKRNRN